MFVDSDDFLNLNAVSEAVELLEKNHADIVIGREKKFQENEVSFTQRDFGTYSAQTDEFVTGDIEVMKDLYNTLSVRYHPEEGWQNTYSGPCARLLKHSLLLEVRFPDGVDVAEDWAWNYFLLRSPGLKIVTATCNWYAYIQHKSSVMHQYSYEFIEKANHSFTYLWQNLERDEGFYLFYTPLLLSWMKLFLNNYYYLKKDAGALTKWLEFWKLCNSYPYNQLHLQQIPLLKNKIKYLLFRCGIMYPWYALKNRITLPAYVISEMRR